MPSLRSALSRLAAGVFMFRLRLRNRGRSAQQIFSDYWAANHWRNAESRSGDGSTLAYTERLRAELPELLTRHGFGSMLDLPCGDFHWFSQVRLPEGVRYIGADIVPDLVADLNRRHGSAQHRFECLDAVNGALPAVDVWLCRDLIFHLPHAAVLGLLDNFIASSIGHLLITSHTQPGIRNEDTFMGGFRLIDLRQPPFALPQPDERLRDHIDGFPPRDLLLYRRETLQAWRRVRGAA